MSMETEQAAAMPAEAGPADAAPVKKRAAKAKKAGKTVKPEPLVYLGPSITGRVKYSTAFKDGVLPAGVQECVNAYPPMEKLFVKESDLAVAARELKKDRSVLKNIYRQTAAKF